MPIIDDNRLKGNYGASLVSERLSANCLVRPVAETTDVGIDLYCETVADRQPFLHFWIQVKSGAQCRLSSDHLVASCSFDIDHLQYWNRQPVPVFAALVPAEGQDAEDSHVYIVDLASQLLAGIPAGQKSYTLKSDFIWRSGNSGDVFNFLNLDVPIASARIQCMKGIVGDIPTPRPSYVLSAPDIPVSRFKKPISDQIRRTAANSILMLYMTNEMGKENDMFRRTMAAVVAQYPDDPDWENFMARGLSHHADLEFDSAIEMYARAKNSIEGDPNVRDKEPWPRIVKDIEHLLSKADSEQSITEAD